MTLDERLKVIGIERAEIVRRATEGRFIGSINQRWITVRQAQEWYEEAFYTWMNI